MKQEELTKAIAAFASLDDSELAERSHMTFRIDFQPKSVAYGGEFDFGEGQSRPINLRKIGKYKCHLFTEFLQLFHESHTNNGRNKWNKARIEKNLAGEYEAQFIWDEEWEMNEIAIYMNSESVRGKWYWEEK